jgi:hypothetical protein
MFSFLLVVNYHVVTIALEPTSDKMITLIGFVTGVDAAQRVLNLVPECGGVITGDACSVTATAAKIAASIALTLARAVRFFAQFLSLFSFGSQFLALRAAVSRASPPWRLTFRALIAAMAEFRLSIVK